MILLFVSEGSVELSDCEHHPTNTPPIHASGFSIHTGAGSTLLQLCYYIRLRIKAAAKRSPLAASVVLVDDSRTEGAVWMGLELEFRVEIIFKTLCSSFLLKERFRFEFLKYVDQ